MSYKRKFAVKNFLKSEEFQDYCNYPENEVKEGSVIWFVHGGYQVPMVGVNGAIGADVSIVPQSETRYLYLQKRLINAPQNDDVQIDFSQAYLVHTSSSGRWVSQCLFENEQWLEKDTVDAALKAVAVQKSYKIVGHLDVFEVNYNKKWNLAWVNIVIDAEGQSKVMLCLLDSGKIEEVPTGDIQLSRPRNPLIRTRYNCFRYWWKGDLLRN